MRRNYFFCKGLIISAHTSSKRHCRERSGSWRIYQDSRNLPCRHSRIRTTHYQRQRQAACRPRQLQRCGKCLLAPAHTSVSHQCQYLQKAVFVKIVLRKFPFKPFRHTPIAVAYINDSFCIVMNEPQGLQNNIHKSTVLENAPSLQPWMTSSPIRSIYRGCKWAYSSLVYKLLAIRPDKPCFPIEKCINSVSFLIIENDILLFSPTPSLSPYTP